MVLPIIGVVIAGAPALADAGGMQVPAPDAPEQTCRAEDLRAEASSMVWPKHQGVLTLDGTCWITPAQLHQRLAQGVPPHLIDVRPHGLRADIVAAAIALPLRDLPLHAFLAQDELVLVGSGLDVAELDHACTGLRQQGFARLTVLQGGAAAWLAHRRGLAQSITPAQWIIGLGQGIAWHLVLGAPLPPQQRAHLPLPPALMLKAGASAQTIATQLLRTQQRLQRRPAEKRTQAAVVFLALDETTAVVNALHALQRLPARPEGHAAAPAVPIYVVQGGWNAYQATVLQNHAIHTSARHGLVRACGAW